MNGFVVDLSVLDGAARRALSLGDALRERTGSCFDRSGSFGHPQLERAVGSLHSSWRGGVACLADEAASVGARLAESVATYQDADSASVAAFPALV